VNAQVDPLPAEPILGWDATTNGNLAQLLQEPSLMGALEGAGITVLAKGVNFPTTAALQNEGSFPAGTTLLTGTNVSSNGSYATGDSNSVCHTSNRVTTNPFPSNFSCSPSSIDGLGITDSSQGGGGIYIHGWAHNLQVANNHIFSNAGSLSGGINVGQGEFAPEIIQGAAAGTNPPGSCFSGNIPNNQQLPYCENLNVNIHHNDISLNSSTGDELFSGTPAGAGGISICTGSDYYKFNYNWVCGNLSSGDGGGVAHMGMSYNGDIEHNSILFNQSLNPTVPANGGGLLVMGTPDITPVCGATTDQDCVPIPSTVLPSDGIGPNLVLNANLIMGNAAESGSGGGLRLQNVNGSDVLSFPTTPTQWWSPTITNNIIADNVAGWDGAGISILDALDVNIAHNTVVANSTTASAGILFTTIGAPLASAAGTDCTQSPTTSCPQPAGLVTIQNSAILAANLPATVTCPANHYAGSTATNGTCRTFSYPYLANNIFWDNSAYYIGVGALSAEYQQNVVSLYSAFTTNLAANQTTTGQCVATSFWDIGARGDTGPTNHGSGVTLAPTYSVLSDASDYPGLNNLASNPNFTAQYCNGSRTPPEFGASGFSVPPGISDASVPNPIFNLTPVATVDEGNNWINLRWGPLTLTNPTVIGADGNYGGGPALGNYALAAGSPAIDHIPYTTFQGVEAVVGGTELSTDFFGNKRPDTTKSSVDIGAVEYQGTSPAILTVAPSSLAFPNTPDGTTSSSLTLTLTNSGGAGATGITVVVTAPFSRSGGTCGTTLAAGTPCTITIVFAPATAVAYTGTATITANVAVANSPVSLTGTGVAGTASATLTPTSWTVSQTRNCPGTGFGVIACALDPSQTFTLRNTGTVPLTGVMAGTLGGTAGNIANYAISTALSTCGNATHTTLAPNATCTVFVQFKPLTSQPTGLKPATVSVSDSAGVQTSTLNGTAH
jgi:hypothetical protein